MRKSFLMILLIACALLAQAQTRQQMGGRVLCLSCSQEACFCKGS